MLSALQNLVQDETAAKLLLLGIVFVLYIALVLLPLLGLLYLLFHCLTLPMQRQERARWFLDLLELGLKDGKSSEATLISLADSRDSSLGRRYQYLASHLEKGVSLEDALGRVPRLLPRQVTAMLQAGCRIGDVTKVFPACRLLLQDGVSQVRGALNYLLLLAFFATPISIIIPLVLQVKVIPIFRNLFPAVSDSPGEAQLPFLTRLVFDSGWLFTSIQVALFGVIWLLVLCYLGGPRLRAWLNLVIPHIPDCVLFRLPWRRKRLQRDFSSMLAVLLDAGLRETDALRLAAETTDNHVMIHRAAEAEAKLKTGFALSEAIQLMDDSAELRWRLGNALRQSGGFTRALAGWHDALDAKAFQLEQAAAQTTTTVLVLLNGLLIGCIVTGLFVVLIDLIQQAELW
jgi:type II secretory pathway component PulF